MVNQISGTLLMIRPVAFHENEQTAVNNYFQEHTSKSDDHVQSLAVKEFDQLVELLRREAINVVVVEDTLYPETPDSIFPNNWISFHANGDAIIYPMFAPNRREERRPDILDMLRKDFELNEVHSLTYWETQAKFLEGTGSLILDRQHEVAYAAISDRTHKMVIDQFKKQSGYRIVTFIANQTVNGQRLPIYHTNVMMAVGEHFAVICLDSIDDATERAQVVESLSTTGKEIIALSEEQIHHFAGNMLQVQNRRNEKFVVMSEAAYDCLDQHQKNRLLTHGQLIHSPIPTIEKLGGGSVRCMMAEVFLPHLRKHKET